MIIKICTIKSNRGDSIKFGRHFKLRNGFDLSGLDADVMYSDTTDDGQVYQTTVLANRNISMEFFIERQNRPDWWIEEQKALAYRTFNPKNNPHKIEFTTPGGKSYYVMANLETLPVFGRGFEQDNRLWLSGLLTFSCNDPYIYDQDSTMYEMGSWLGGFEFPLEIPEDGLEMGTYNESLIINVLNKGQASTGIIVEFVASTTVVNPSILNINTDEKLELRTTMEPGDIITVSTYKRAKTATLNRNTNITDVFYTIPIDSQFVTLLPGDNLIRYDAEEGLEGLQVRIKFNNMHMGV